jgi:hypothetical protein
MPEMAEPDPATAAMLLVPASIVLDAIQSRFEKQAPGCDLPDLDPKDVENTANAGALVLAQYGFKGDPKQMAWLALAGTLMAFYWPRRQAVKAWEREAAKRGMSLEKQTTETNTPEKQTTPEAPAPQAIDPSKIA